MPGLVGAPTPPNDDNGAGPQRRFPNPFNQYRDFVEKTSIWPIGVGAAIGMTSLGDAPDLGNTALRQADSSSAGLAPKAHFITAHPGSAFEVARDAVLNYVPKLLSNFSLNPLGK